MSTTADLQAKVSDLAAKHNDLTQDRGLVQTRLDEIAALDEIDRDLMVERENLQRRTKRLDREIEELAGAWRETKKALDVALREDALARLDTRASANLAAQLGLHETLRAWVADEYAPRIVTLLREVDELSQTERRLRNLAPSTAGSVNSIALDERTLLTIFERELAPAVRRLIAEGRS